MNCLLKYLIVGNGPELYKRCNPKKGDILLSKVETTGIPVIINIDQPFSLFVSSILLKFNKN